jgi:predicted SprT family Zn-dependent metalloprotease
MSDYSTLADIYHVLDGLNLSVPIRWSDSRKFYGKTLHRRASLSSPWEVSHLEFSRVLWPHLPVAERLDTIIHEAAHAMLPPGEGHGPAWRNLMRRLGGSPRARSPKIPEVEEATAKWRGTCPNGHLWYRNRLTQKVRRGTCSRCSHVYDPTLAITWKELR